MSDDTTRLLRECDAGVKMAISSIDEILEEVKNDDMKQLLRSSKNQHEDLEADICEQLNKMQVEEKEPAAMAKGMSWLKTNLKMNMDASDATVADLITDGCNMGVKSLQRYLNQYPAADACSKDYCTRLIGAEESLAASLRPYL